MNDPHGVSSGSVMRQLSREGWTKEEAGCWSNSSLEAVVVRLSDHHWMVVCYEWENGTERLCSSLWAAVQFVRSLRQKPEPAQGSEN